MKDWLVLLLCFLSMSVHANSKYLELCETGDREAVSVALILKKNYEGDIPDESEPVDCALAYKRLKSDVLNLRCSGKDGEQDFCNRHTLTSLDWMDDKQNYRGVWLAGHQIADIRKLTRIEGLNNLDLSGNLAFDSDVLLELSSFLGVLLLNDIPTIDDATIQRLNFIFQNINILELARTSVSDIGFIREMQRLQFLDISYTKVRELAPVKNSLTLQYLGLKGLGIKDCSGYTGPDYNRVDLSDNAIRTLKGCEVFITPFNHSILLLNNNQIEDLSGITAFSDGFMVSLAHNKISNVIGLRDANDMFYPMLYLEGNPITHEACMRQLDGYVSEEKIRLYCSSLGENLNATSLKNQVKRNSWHKDLSLPKPTRGMAPIREHSVKSVASY